MALSRKIHRHAPARPALLVTAVLAGATALFGPQRDARADEVSPTGKGIVGGALLGAEVVTITESLVGVRSGWAYVIGAVLGAGAGGAGGYFVEQGSSDGRAPVYLLAGGLALVIPAVVLSLDATRFRPEEGATEDHAPTGPDANPGMPGGSVVSPAGGSAPSSGPSGPSAPPVGASGPAPVTPAPAGAAPPPQSLFDVRVQQGEGAFRLGLPVPAVGPMFSAAETRTYGLTKNDALVRMPVLHVAF